MSIHYGKLTLIPENSMGNESPLIGDFIFFFYSKSLIPFLDGMLHLIQLCSKASLGFILLEGSVFNSFSMKS